MTDNLDFDFTGDEKTDNYDFTVGAEDSRIVDLEELGFKSGMLGMAVSNITGVNINQTIPVVSEQLNTADEDSVRLDIAGLKYAQIQNINEAFIQEGDPQYVSDLELSLAYEQNVTVEELKEEAPEKEAGKFLIDSGLNEDAVSASVRDLQYELDNNMRSTLEEYAAGEVLLAEALRELDEGTTTTEAVLSVVKEIIPFAENYKNGLLAGGKFKSLNERWRNSNIPEKKEIIKELKANEEDWLTHLRVLGSMQGYYTSDKQLEDNFFSLFSAGEIFLVGKYAKNAGSLLKMKRASGNIEGATSDTVETLARSTHMGDVPERLVDDAVEEILPAQYRIKENVSQVGVSGAVTKELNEINRAVDLILTKGVDTLSPTQRVKAQQEAFTRLNDGEFRQWDIVDHDYVEDVFGGTEKIRIHLGGGQDGMSGLPTKEAAESMAKTKGFHDGEYSLTKSNDVWYVTVTRDVSEKGFSTEAGIDTWARRNKLVSWFLGSDQVLPKDTVLKIQHLAAGQQARVEEGFKLLRNKVQAVSRKELKDLEAALVKGEAEQKWYTRSELNTIYNRALSDKEWVAYTAYRKMNDMDYMIRNNDIRRKLVNEGFTEVSIKTSHLDYSSQLGRVVQDSTKLRGSDIHILDADSGKHMRRGTDMSKQLKGVEEGKYHLVEVFDKEAKFFGGRPVTHVLVNKKAFKNKQLRRNVLNYQAGGHRVYTGNYFGKQARMVTDPDTGGNYFGSTKTHHNFESLKEAKEWSEGMNAAGKLWKEVVDDTSRISVNSVKIAEVTKGRVASFEEYNKLVDDGTVLVNPETGDIMPFEALRDGVSPDTVLKSGAQKGKTADFEDDVIKWAEDSGRLFYSQKGDRLRGPEGELATILSPFDATNRAVANASRIQAFGKYQERVLNQWIADFSPYLKNANRHPSEVFKKPDWKDRVDQEIKNRAEIGKLHINKFLDADTFESKVYDDSIRRMSEFFDDKGHKKTAQWVREQNNPAGALRTLAFDMYLGMFNVKHLILQPQHMVAMLAMAKKNGLKATGAYWWLRQGLNKLDKPEHIDLIAKRQKIVTGIEPDVFKQMLKDLDDSGSALVGGSLSVLESFGDNAIKHTMLNNVRRTREAGRWMFFEAEKINKISAYAAAWLDRYDNVGKSAKRVITNQDEAASVIMEADRYSGNMTRASSAFWQKGIASIPTQFFSYQARMLEAMFGRQVKGWERVRLIGSQLAFYGAAGIPAGNYIADQLFEHTNLEGEAEMVANFFADGIIEAVVDAAIADTTAGQTLGPFGGGLSGIMLIDNIMDPRKAPYEFIIGPGGAAVERLGKGTLGLIQMGAFTLQNMGRGREILSSSVVNKMASMFSGSSNAMKAYLAYKLDEKRDTQGRTVVEGIDLKEAFMIGAGFTLEAEDAYWKSNEYFHDLSKQKREASKIFIKEYQRILENVKDPTEYFNQVQDLGDMIGLVDEEIKEDVLDRTFDWQRNNADRMKSKMLDVLDENTKLKKLQRSLNDG